MEDIFGHGIALNTDEVAVEKEVYAALDDACEASERGGRWSAVPEVHAYADLDLSTTKDTLKVLVKKSLAEEKIASSGQSLGLFRPTKLGAASYGNSFPFDDQYGKDPGQKSLDGGKNKGDNGKDPGGQKGGQEFEDSKVPKGQDDPFGDPFDPGTNGGKKPSGHSKGHEGGVKPAWDDSKPKYDGSGSDEGWSGGGGGGGGEGDTPHYKWGGTKRPSHRKGAMKPAWDDSKPKHNGNGVRKAPDKGDGLGFPKGSLDGFGEFVKPEVPIKNNNYIDPKIPLIDPDEYREYNQKPYKIPSPEPDPIKPNVGEKVGQDVGNMAATIITSALFGGAMGGAAGGVAGGAGRVAMPMTYHDRQKCSNKKKKGRK